MTDIERAAKCCDDEAGLMRTCAAHAHDEGPGGGWEHDEYIVKAKVCDKLAHAIRALPASPVEAAMEEFTKACAEWHKSLDANPWWPHTADEADQRNRLVTRRNEAWRALLAAESAKRAGGGGE